MRLTLLLAAAAAVFGCDDGGSTGTAQEGTDAVVDAGLPDGAAPDAALSDATPADADMPDADAPDMAMADMAMADAAPLPAERPITEDGPFAVGYRVINVTYTPPLTGEPRTLRTALWYPTRAETGTTVRYGGLVERPSIRGGADPIALDGPVLIFSHGNQGFAEQSFFFTEFFASHGWLVAAPDHTGNTFNGGGIPIEQLFELRPQDISAVIDALDDLPDDDPLAGRSAGGVLVSGHSFGGYTTLAVAGSTYAIDALRAACRAEANIDEATCDYLDAAAPRYAAGFGDPRVIAGIPLTPAGANVFQNGTVGIDVPVMMVTAGRDQTLPNPEEGDPLWDAMDGPDAIRLDFPNAGHFSFASFCGVLGNFGEDDGCGDTFLDPNEVHRITRTYALAFARLYLRGDATDMGLLDGTEMPDADDVDITLKD